MRPIKEQPFRTLPLVFSLITLLFAIGGGVRMLTTKLHITKPVIDFSRLPDGRLLDNSYLSRFYRDKSTVFIRAEPNGRRYLAFETNELGSQDYNGFDIRSVLEVSADSELHLTWRIRGNVNETIIHFKDSPTQGFKNGEDWSVMAAPAAAEWTETVIRLSDFRRNDWQPDNAPNDGRIDLPLTGFDLVVGPGSIASVEIARAELVWNTPLFPAVLIPFAIVSFALILSLRTGRRLTPSKESSVSADREALINYGFVLGNRHALLTLSLAFLLQSLILPESLTRPEAVLAWGLYAAVCLSGDFVPRKLFAHDGFAWRLYPFFAFWWLYAQPSGPALATVFAASLIPALYRRKRFLVLLLFLLTLILVFFVPGLSPENGKINAALGFGTAAIVILAATELFIRGKAEAGLRRTQLLYDAVFNHSTDLIFTLSADRILTSANNAFIAHTRLESALVNGMKAEDFLHVETGRPAENTAGTIRYDAKIGLNGTLSREVQVSETPIIDHGKIAGFLVVAADISERKKLETDLKKANALLEEQANIDSLTLVGNRRSFDAKLTAEWKRAARAQTPLALLMIDVDYFKKYNDSFGHIAGDECLVKIAKTLESKLRRSSDFLARFGGEEFAVIIHPVERDEAVMIAEILRKAVEDLGIYHSGPESGGKVNISIGIHVMTPKADGNVSELQELVRMADGALYRAKQEGRNRVCVYEGEADGSDS